MSSKNRYFSMCKSKKKSKLGNRSLDFSEIWHEGSLIGYLKSDGARFSKKNYCYPHLAFKEVFFTVFYRFLAFLGIRSVDFSNFWHEGSLKLFLKSDPVGFKKIYISVHNTHLKGYFFPKKNFFSEIFPKIFFSFFFKKTNFFASKKKIIFLFQKV